MPPLDSDAAEKARTRWEETAQSFEAPADPPWPPLQPLPPIAPPVPDLPPEMVPEPLRPWLQDVAERVSIPLSYVAAPALVALGAVVGRTVGIRPMRRDDWLVVPNLWGGIIGRPGMMKSAAVAEAVRPVRRLEAVARDRHQAAMTDHAIEAEVTAVRAASARESLKKAAKAADFAGMESAKTTLAAALAATAEPTERRYSTSDGTVEKLGELLNQNPRGLLLVRDELAGWMALLDRSGREGDREFFLESWNGTGGFIVDRIGRGTLAIPALCLSIVGGIQPSKLQATIDGAIHDDAGLADGLLQRFQMLVWPDDPGEWKEIDRWPDRAARDRAFAVFDGLDRLDPATIGAEAGHGGDIPALRFDLDGQDLFLEWRRELETRVRSPEMAKTPAFESHLSKFRSLMPSLALLFHLTEVVDGTTTGPVGLPAAQRAAVWCDFLEAHARKVYAPELAGDTAAGHALAERITTGAVTDGMSVREIGLRDWSGLTSGDAIDAAITYLARLGWVRVEVAKAGAVGGRPSRKLRLHPDLGGAR